MKVTFQTNRTHFVRTIPTRWEEVTFKQYIDIQNAGDDYVKLLSVFTGMDHDIIRKSSVASIDVVLSALSFIYTPMPMELPEKIMGYQVPKDLGFKTVAQFQDIRDDLRVKRTPEEQILRYPVYCATYALEEYDWRKAESMQNEFMLAPAPEVLAVGNFILRKLVGLRIGKTLNFPKRSTRLQRLKLVLKGWLIRLDFMGRLYQLKRKVGISGMKF